METVACHFCDATETTLVLVGPDRMLPTDEMFRMVRCTVCGLFYQTPRPTPTEIGRYYPSDYAPHLALTPTQLKHQRGLQKRCQVVLAHRQTGRLLDIGCGGGNFLAAMRAQGGWETQGVELSAEAAARARQAWGLTVFNGELLAAGLPAAAFDVITLWDVLEHLHEPRTVLQEAARLLVPNGLLVLRTPYIESINRHLFGSYWGGWDLPRHLYLFPLPVLHNLLNKAGFTLLQTLFPLGTYADLMISYRFWLNNYPPSPLHTGLSLLSRLAPLLWPYAAWADRTGRGAHVTIVARKETP